MPTALDLIEETKSHFSEGARSVRAYTNDITLVITKSSDDEYSIVVEEDPFRKSKTRELEPFFTNVFGIEARY